MHHISLLHTTYETHLRLPGFGFGAKITQIYSTTILTILCIYSLFTKNHFPTIQLSLSASYILSMTKFFLPLVAAIIFFSSCSEKFDVAAPYKDVTVVYGFLDMGDTAHYVRIQKAFLDENKSAVDMAKVSDSSFFSDIDVRIDRYSVAGSHAYINSIPLTRVDLTAEGYPKQPGAFFTAPNYAYKFTNTLDPQYFYRLKITHTSTGAVDSVDAPVINNVRIGTYGGFYVELLDNSNANLSGLSFFSTIANRGFNIYATYAPAVGYDYNSEESPAQIAQTIIRFNWVDSDAVTGAKTFHYYDFDAGYNALSSKGKTVDFTIKNQTMFSAMAVGMGKAPANTYRLMEPCDLTLYLSTSDYSKYQQAMLFQGTGLTASEISPIYTNVKGKDALGLFTSRAMRTGKIIISDMTIDSLRLNPILDQVKINGRNH